MRNGFSVVVRALVPCESRTQNTVDHAASVEVNLLDDGIDRYHCPMDSSLRVWSDCICVSQFDTSHPIESDMRDGQLFNVESTMSIESSKTGDMARSKSTFSMRVISRSIPLRTTSRSWLAIS